jgi:hypothetical protein
LMSLFVFYMVITVHNLLILAPNFSRIPKMAIKPIKSLG